MSSSKDTVSQIPFCSIDASPLDKEEDWKARLKEELVSLISYQKMNKENDQDWFILRPSKDGIKWSGTCWYFHQMQKYEFSVEFEIPARYPHSPPEITLPALDGMTAKMYRGGRICMDIHFSPLWQRNAPKFGVAHAMALALAPWLATEIPELVKRGVVFPKLASDDETVSTTSSSTASSSSSSS